MLPAASQFEKWECTFFNLEFPHNYFHLRRPVFEPLEGTLPEYEIHARLCRALGAYSDDDLEPLARCRSRSGEPRTHGTCSYARRRTPGSSGKLAAGPAVRDARPDAAHARRRRRGRCRGGVGPRTAAARSLRCLDPPGRHRTAGGDALGDASSTRSSPTRRESRSRSTTTTRRCGASRPPTADPSRDPELLARVRPLRSPRNAPSRRPTTSRSCSRPVSVARPPPTRSTATRRGGRRTSTVPCASRRATPTRLGLADGDRARVTTKRGSAVAIVEVTDTMRRGAHLAARTASGSARRSSRRGRRGAERTHRVRRPRLVRRHAAPQARAAPGSRSRDGVRRTRFDDWPCPIARTTDLIGDWWTPLVMREAFLGRRRFEEFQTALEAPRAVLDGPAQAAVRRGHARARRRTRTPRCATSTASPRRAAPSATCSPRCGAGAATGCGPTAIARRSC